MVLSKPRWSAFGAIVLIFALAGCATPKAEPFEKYRASIVTLRDGAEKSIELDAKASKDRFVDKAVSDPKTGKYVTDHLRLDLAGQGSFGYAPPSEPALFMGLLAASRALDSLNDAFVEHADLLAALAGSDVAAEETIDKAAADINASVKNAVDALNSARSTAGDNAGLIKIPGDGLALVSTAVAELLRQYLIKKQSDYLKAAIDESLPAVREYASSVRSLVEVIAIGERTRYAAAMSEVSNGLAVNGVTDAEKRRMVLRALDLTDGVVVRLDTLGAMDQAYTKLPDAFASLRDAAGGAAISLKDIESLAADARRLTKRYETLRKANTETTGE